MDQTEILPPTMRGARAAALLAEGRLVAFPTETVYGLGGDARPMTGPWRGSFRPRGGRGSTR
jgi:tRNA A37 threonylcarbamoyladenosine synthetase subunit TsaC/SUA5/YrdC